MPLAQDVKIEFGDASNLGVYDPTIDVYTDPERIGGVQYNIFQKPKYDEDLEQTVLVDEIGDHSTSRTSYRQNHLTGDGVTTLDLSSGIVGTLTLKGWTNSGAGWSYGDITTGLSGTTLTLQNAVRYKGIDRYVNGALFDQALCEEGENKGIVTSKGYGVYLSDVAVWDTSTSAPLITYSFDRRGYLVNHDLVNAGNFSYQYLSGNLYYLSANGQNVGQVNEPSTAPTIVGDDLVVENTATSANRFIRIDTTSNIKAEMVGKGLLYYIEYDIETVGVNQINWNLGGTFITITSGTSTKYTDYTGKFYAYFYATSATPTIQLRAYRASGSGTFKITIKPNFIFKQVHPTPSINSVADVVRGSALTYAGRIAYDALRVNNQAGYLTTSAVLTPTSGSIAGSTVSQSWGTAVVSVSGNTIICVSAGSCHGILLDTGQWYTFSEGYFGDNSGHVYDVSGNDNHLAISGQTAAQTWQQAGGLTDLGYDWLSIHGGHRYTNGTASEDIFIPHEPNTNSVPTISLLPGGYTLAQNLESGVFIQENTEWILANGLYGTLNGKTVDRTELDNYAPSDTFSQSKGHYVTTSGSQYQRYVIYPVDSSEPLNTRLDFKPDGINSSMGINMRVFDAASLSQMASDYMKNLPIPATKRNIRVIGHIYDTDNGSFESLKQTRFARVSASGIDIISGRGKIKASVNQFGVPDAFQLSIFGGNFEMFAKLKDVYLKDLDLGTYTISLANMISSHTAGNASMFALVDHGQFYSGATIWLEDITPQFRIQKMLQLAFDEVGIIYNSTFLDSTQGGKLYLDYRGEWLLSDAAKEAIEDDELFNLVGSAPLGYRGLTNSTQMYFNDTNMKFASDSIGNATTSTTDGTYTSATNAWMSFRLFTRVKLDASAYVMARLDVGIEINGVKQLDEEIHVSLIHNEFVEIVLNTRKMRIKSGDVIRPYFYTTGVHTGATTYSYSKTLAMVILLDFGGANTTTFTNTIYPNIVEGQTLTMNQYVDQEMTAFDLFKGICSMFNIISMFDAETNELVFEPYPDFYTEVLDWQGLEDETKPSEIKFLSEALRQEITYKYKNDSKDYHIREYNYKNPNDDEFAAITIDNGDNYLKGEQEIINPYFSATVDKTIEDVTSPPTLPTIRYAANDGGLESQPYLDCERRILYYVGSASGNYSVYSGSAGSLTKTDYTSYPRLAFSEALSGESWQSLSYDSFTDDSGDRAGLFETYYSPMLASIREGITWTAWINLGLNEINAKPLNKIIYINNNRWIINKIIDYNPLNDQPTKVEFLKYVGKAFTIAKNNNRIGRTRERVNGLYNPNDGVSAPNGGDTIGGNSGFTGGVEQEGNGNIAFGSDNIAPRKANTYQFGKGLETYSPDVAQFGEYNEYNADAIFQVGGGTSDSDRHNAVSVEIGDGIQRYELKVSGEKVFTEKTAPVNAIYHNDGSYGFGYKIMTFEGTTNADGEVSITFEDDLANNVFNNTPYVMASVETTFTDVNDTYYTCVGDDIDNTACTIYVSANGSMAGSGITVKVIAIGT